MSSDKKIVFTGLEKAGKTLLYSHLAGIKYPEYIPTLGFNTTAASLPNTPLLLWDLGGNANIRPYWKAYYTEKDLLVFVVNLTDSSRFTDAATALLTEKQEFWATANSSILVPKFMSALEQSRLVVFNVMKTLNIPVTGVVYILCV